MAPEPRPSERQLPDHIRPVQHGIELVHAPTVHLHEEVGCGEAGKEPRAVFCTAAQFCCSPDVSGAVPQKFWAHGGKKGHVRWSSGQVGIKTKENTV